MAEKTLGPLPRYDSIGNTEKLNIERALKHPLSGYIGGMPSTGYFVNQLADEWQAAFDVNYAVPCNSATSGLMAACMAAGIGKDDEVWVSTYTMSASATCAMILGATVKFLDISPTTFCMMPPMGATSPKAIIVTNLFGMSAALIQLRAYCDSCGAVLIEDNAQAPFATSNKRFTGTIGHMGVFSLNVHKHMQCGEGGVVVTDERDLAYHLEDAINHGELSEARHVSPHRCIGGNFRMTELTAAVACAQLKKGPALVRGRIELAEAITAIFKQVSFVTPPLQRLGEVHAYYLWAGKVTNGLRSKLVNRLRDRGVPFRAGYSVPLHRLFGCDYSLPVAEAIEDQRLITFEVCAYDPKKHHLLRMTEIILEEAEKIEGEAKAA